MKSILIAVTCAVLIGCPQEELEQPKPSAQEQYEVEFLFETNGVQFYRFYDKGDYHYYAVTKYPNVVSMSSH